MNLIFFGTPDFAIPSLELLIENNYRIVGVVTVPDKAKGRGLKPEPSPIKKIAQKYKLKIFTPENLRDQTFNNQLKEIEPDLGIVVAYKILPTEIYTIPKFGTFNLHASLLPKYRGAAPIQWALINGEKVTGVTTFFLQEKVDTGNIILQKEVNIDDEDNLQTLHDKLSLIGAELVLETVKLIQSGDFEVKPQNDSEASLAPKITKEICHIDWNHSSTRIHNLVRGLSPHPGAFTFLGNRIFKIYRTRIDENLSIAETGKIIFTEERLFVNTRDNLIEILELQPESRKKMTAKEFLKGYKNLLNKYLKFD